MQFYKKTRVDKRSQLIRFSIKTLSVFVLFFIIITLVDKVEFPSPKKELQNIIPNENFKIIK
tara:strand:- start:473 stop:658 length:186 start_codon:yes stop_codon:yes gene_type:complete